MTINDPSNTDVTADPASLTFTTANWSSEQTVTVNAAHDGDASDEREAVTHTVSGADYDSIGVPDVTVTVNDDDPAVTVSFGQASYTVAEGATAQVTVSLSADPNRTVNIPISASHQGGATAADYSGIPALVTFGSDATQQAISFTATDDMDADLGEVVTLSFGTLPDGVSAGTPAQAAVSITDDDTVANTSAMGQPSIDGTLVQVGEPLTANTSTITDDNGIPADAYRYQWSSSRGGTTYIDIAGATGAGYRPVLADLGKTLKVTVTFTDSADYDEGPLISDATTAVAASPRGNVIYSATLTVKEYAALGTTFRGYNIEAGAGSVAPDTFQYNGQQYSVKTTEYEVGGDLEFATDVSLGSGDFILFLGDEPFLIEDPGTDTTFSFSNHGLTWSDGASVEVRLSKNRPANGGPSLSGTARPGQTLTAAAPRSDAITVPAGVIAVPQDWSLIPEGVGRGERFGLIFLTDTGHAPTSTSIADYNTYVQSQAGAEDSHSDIQTYDSGFKVLGSTDDTDARDNTATTFTDDDKGVPIYWLNGSQVANDYEDLYDRSWANESTPTNRKGIVVSNREIWTGSNNKGAESRFQEAGGDPVSEGFGASDVGAGELDSALPDHEPLKNTQTYSNSQTTRPYYALSAVFWAPDGISDHDGIPADETFDLQWTFSEDGTSFSNIEEALSRDSAANGRIAPAGLRHPSHRTGRATFTAPGSPSDGCS